MLIGLVWTALGFIFAEMWWAVGGSLLFLMGALSIPSPKHEKEAIAALRRDDRGEKVQTP